MPELLIKVPDDAYSLRFSQLNPQQFTYSLPSVQDQHAPVCLRQRTVDNQGRRRFLLVDDIIFSRQNLTKIFFAIWLELHGVFGERYYFFSENRSDIIFFPNKSARPPLSTGRCLNARYVHSVHVYIWSIHVIKYSLSFISPNGCNFWSIIMVATRVLITWVVICILIRPVGHYMQKRSQQWRKVFSVISRWCNLFNYPKPKIGFSCVTQKLGQKPPYFLSGEMVHRGDPGGQSVQLPIFYCSCLRVWWGKCSINPQTQVYTRKPQFANRKP